MPRNTHPRKRPTYRRPEATDTRRETTERMARSLVDRGLASILILDGPLRPAEPLMDRSWKRVPHGR